MSASARYFHVLDGGRVQCDLCPRACTLSDGVRGVCFVRMCEEGRMVLTTYGRSTGFCVDPVEKKPLNHFHPGSSVLSFGTAGCNLTCSFCQNWDISRSRSTDRACDEASPSAIAEAAERLGCRGVAYTYNDPVVFLEYAVDTAAACRERGIANIAVTAGYMLPRPREEFFGAMDAVNIDLKAFSEDFYRRLCGAELGVVKDTLLYVAKETSVWLEIATLLIPGENDSDAEIGGLSEWVARELGPSVPLHFTAFHPDWRMRDRAPTPLATLRRARAIALGNGLRYVYTGNVRDEDGGSTRCHACGTVLIGRSGYELTRWQLTAEGHCARCGAPCAGVFDAEAGHWGSRRMPVRMS